MFNGRKPLVKPVATLQCASMKLEQDRIVTEALALMDQAGFDGFNMRALAARLAVRASALYWHVGGRDELLSHMAGRFYRRAVNETPQQADWRAWLIAFGRAFRRALMETRDSARLCAVARPLAEDGGEPTARLAAPLEAAGLSRRQALTYEASVISLTLGWTVYEQSDALHDHLARIVGFEEGYATGLEALVRGFAPPEEIAQ